MKDINWFTSLFIGVRWRKVWLAALLAWVAGFVDVIGYLTLIHIFTSHMSGNSVATMADLARHQWSDALRRVFPIPMFVLGVFIGAMLGMTAKRRGIRQQLSLALGFETVLLAAFMVYEHWLSHDRDFIHLPLAKFCLLTGLLAMAMGVQSAALRHVWGKPMHTTFITGMLTHFAENAALILLDDGNKSKHRAQTQGYLRLMLLDGGIWCAFVLGAACGGFGKERWGIFTLIAPLCILAMTMVWDYFQPIHES